MQRVFILTATSLVILGIGVPRYQGVAERIDRLEESEDAGPIRARRLHEEIGRLAERQIQAQREGTEEKEHLLALVEDLEERLALATAALEDHAGLFEDLSATDTDDRLAALEAGVEVQWTGLRRAVDAASSLATEAKSELEGLVEPSEHDRWTRMVGPSVKLAGDTTVGSGVLLPSRRRASGEGYDTLLLTAWHVVRDIRADSPRQDPPIPVTIYRADGTQRQERAELIVYEPSLDVALLRLKTDSEVSHGARLATSAELDATGIFRPVVAVGCPLGNDPIPTRGEVSDTDHAIDGSTYWMISAPTYIGNSGGGIFDARSHRLMGIFSKIYTHGSLRPTVVPHMGLATPMDRVYDWLATREEVEVVEGPEGVELRLAPPPTEDPADDLATPPSPKD